MVSKRNNRTMAFVSVAALSMFAVLLALWLWAQPTDVDLRDSEAVAKTFIGAVLADDTRTAGLLHVGGCNRTAVRELRVAWTGSEQACEILEQEVVLAVDLPSQRLYSIDWLETTTSSDGLAFNAAGHGVEVIRDGETWRVQRVW